MAEKLISRRDILKAAALGGTALALERFGIAQASILPNIEPTHEAAIITPGQVFYTADTHRRIVCFTFDDGGQRMRKVMDIANKRRVKMTFFPTGNAINADPKLYKDMYEAGHEIGNHTQSHADLTTLTAVKIESQVVHAREALWNAVGKEVPQSLLRPPFGAGVRSSKDVDPDLLKTAKKLGYGIVMWNVTSAGTSKYATVDSIKKRVESSLRNGVIVLEHPTLFDTTAFADILDYALSQGFTPQTISEGLK